MRSIPPRTRSDVWRRTRRHKRRGGRRKPRPPVGPAHWAYATRPIFRKVREPLVDVFREAAEVRIIIDLGNFPRGGIRFGKKGNKYQVHARKGEREFHEEIALPSEVDLEAMKESFRNGILQITLPRKRGPKDG